MSKKEDLVRVLAELDTLYELGEDCVHPDTGVVVSDDEYDDMVQDLKNLDPKNARFTRPSDSKVKSGVKKVKHDPPLTSISKASHEDLEIQEQMLFKWIADSSVGVKTKRFTLDDRTYNKEKVSYPRDYLYQQYKLDGVALALYYENGDLKRAGLRPRDGIEGEDVTEQTKYVSGIPQKLNEPLTCSIRGELICKKSDFEKVQKRLAAAGEKLRANPRNHAAGAIRQFKDPTVVKDMGLSFIAYGIEGLDNQPYTSETERAKWANKSLGITYVQTRPFNFYDLQKLEDNAPELDYMVDGCVIGVDDLETQEQLGRSGSSATGNPKGKIAWKFRAEVAKVKIKDIVSQCGRTGRIVPVAVFDGVQLAGTTVSRATLHNFGFVKEKEIKIGTEVKVVKAGEIIPKVIGVVSNTGKPHIPSSCPSCGKKVELEQSKTDATKYDLVCYNGLDCPAQNIGRLLHYLDVVGVLGIGESIVEQLVNGNEVSSFADFYKLDLEDVESCGLSERQGLLALAAIHMVPPEKDNDKLRQSIAKAKKTKKNIAMAKVIAGFGIKNVSNSTAKALIEYFQEDHLDAKNVLDFIRSASVDELQKAENVGDTTAQSFHDEVIEMKGWIDDLLNFVEPELPKQGKFTGKSFCLSGKVDKRVLKDWIEERGGKISGSVGSKTDYLVAGDGSGAKSDSAKKLGVKIITAEELEKML